MVSKRSPKFYSMAERAEDAMLAEIDTKKELQPFLDKIEQAIEEAKEGKLKSLKKVATTIETVRILTAFRDAILNGDIQKIEYYGSLVRDYMMDKPKVALEHSAGEGMKGVVVLPAATKGE